MTIRTISCSRQDMEGYGLGKLGSNTRWSAAGVCVGINGIIATYEMLGKKSILTAINTDPALPIKAVHATQSVRF